MTEIVKICTSCNLPLPLNAYGKSAKGKFGRKAECKECFSLRNKERYIEKSEEIIEQNAEWAEQNPDKVKKYKENYYKNKKNKEK